MRLSTEKSLSPNEKQISYRADAIRFLGWGRFSLNSYVEKLDAAETEEFESGEIPKRLLDEVRSAWSNHLKHAWPPEGTCAVAATVLKNLEDLAAWNNCLYGQEHKLPKRIRTAVFSALKKRADEIHSGFFANYGEALLAVCLRVWQSQKSAMHKLMIQATGEKVNERGNLDIEQYYLDLVAAKGTAVSIGDLRYFLGGVVPVSLNHGRGIVYDKTLMPDLVLLPDHNGLWTSEARLNRFLKKLGRALSSKKKRGAELYVPDWLHSVDQTERYIVLGWCENITVDSETWPPLCFLTTSALVRFLRLCNVKYCKLARKDPRTIERAIQRLGLVRMPRGQIKYVEKRGGKFYFT